jgi:hypothetical protein
MIYNDKETKNIKSVEIIYIYIYIYIRYENEKPEIEFSDCRLSDHPQTGT